MRTFLRTTAILLLVGSVAHAAPGLYFSTPGNVTTITAKEADDSIIYWEMDLIAFGIGEGEIMAFRDMRDSGGSNTRNYSYSYRAQNDLDHELLFQPAHNDAKAYAPGTQTPGMASYTYTLTGPHDGDPLVDLVSTVTIHAPDASGTLIEASNAWHNTDVAANPSTEQDAMSRLNDSANVPDLNDIWEESARSELAAGTTGTASSTARVKFTQEALDFGMVPGITFTLSSINVYGSGSHTAIHDAHGPDYFRLWINHGIKDGGLAADDAAPGGPDEVTTGASLLINIAAVTPNANPADASQSTVTVAPAEVPATGSHRAVITVTLRDAGGLLVPGKRANIDLSGTTDGGSDNEFDTIFEVTPGVYVTALRSTTPEVKTIDIEVDASITLNNHPTVTFLGAGDPHPGESEVTFAPDNVPANGLETSTLTIKVADVNSIPKFGLPDSAFQFSSTGTGDAFGTVVETVPVGTYTVDMTSTVAEAKTVTVEVRNDADTAWITLSDEPLITFLEEGAVDAVECRVTVNRNYALADGTEGIIVTMAIRDGNQILIDALAGSIVVSGDGTAVAGAVNEDYPGIYTCAVTDTAAEMVTISVNVGGTPLTQQPEVYYYTSDAELIYSGDDLTDDTANLLGTLSMTISCQKKVSGEQFWEAVLIRPQNSTTVRIDVFDDKTDSGDFDYAGTYAWDNYGMLLGQQTTTFQETAKTADAYKYTFSGEGATISFRTKFELRPAGSLGTIWFISNTYTNKTAGDELLDFGWCRMQMMLETEPYAGAQGGVLTDTYDVNLQRQHLQVAAGDPAFYDVTDNIDLAAHNLPGSNLAWDPTGLMWGQATVLDNPATSTLGLTSGRTFAIRSQIIAYYPADAIGRVFIDSSPDYQDSLTFDIDSREWLGSNRSGVSTNLDSWDNTRVLGAGRTNEKTFTFLCDIDDYVPLAGDPVISVATEKGTPEEGLDWVYQNFPVSDANGSHKVALTVTVEDLNGNNTVTVTVAKQAASGPGEVVIQAGATALEKLIVGSPRADLNDGALVLEVTATGDIAGATTVYVLFESRIIGDVDGNGGAEPGDLSLLINKLNGVPTPTVPNDRSFDLDANGGAEPTDVSILINVLNGVL